MCLRNYSLVIVSLVLLLGCARQPIQSVTPLNKGEKVLFFDDFSGISLDTNKWTVEETGMHVNNELQAYVNTDSTVYLLPNAPGAHHGVLVLQPHFAPKFVTKDHQNFDFVSGKITTNPKMLFTYGTAEARIRLPKGEGLWPAWWILGTGHWPETGEIDVMESIGEADWASAAIHGPGYSGDAGLTNRLYFDAKNDITQWHVYAVDWTPDSIVFKYDGKPMYRITKPMTQFFGKWAFDNKKYLILNFAVGGVYPYKINGINKPYYGLSETSLQDIKAAKAKMLVDWVRITQKN